MKMRKLFLFAAVAAVLASCGGKGSSATDDFVSEAPNPPVNRVFVSPQYVVYINGDVLPFLDLERTTEVCGVASGQDAFSLKNYFVDWHKANETAKNTLIGGRQAVIPSPSGIKELQWSVKHTIDTLCKYGVDADLVLNNWYWTDFLYEGGYGLWSKEYTPEKAAAYNYNVPAYSYSEKTAYPTSETHLVRFYAYLDLGKKEAMQGKRSGEKNPAIPTIKDDFTGLELVFIEGGTFVMGYTKEQSYKNGYAPTFNAHNVTLNNFYLGKYEVTQTQWETVMGKNPSEFQTGINRPVEKVSWNDAQKFIRKLNEKTGKHYRLPTEAEWEYAARGGAYSSGIKLYSNGEGWAGNKTETSDIGASEPDELGIYDMSGNVGEWCSDWFDYYRSEPQTNPQGPAQGYGRVVRGDNWKSNYQYLSYRYYADPAEGSNTVGFRLACNAE
jgi:formylglycine-generating enzyme required for sulfatase activity